MILFIKKLKTEKKVLTNAFWTASLGNNTFICCLNSMREKKKVLMLLKFSLMHRQGNFQQQKRRPQRLLFNLSHKYEDLS